MQIKYEDDKLALAWKYKIIRTKHKTSISNSKIETTQNVITINKVLLSLANVRKVLFIYKNPEKDQYQLTTQEPPAYVDYEVIKTYSNDKQTNIVLPHKFLNLTDNMSAELIYYPTEGDYYSPDYGRIDLILSDYTPAEQSKARVRQIDGKVYLVWNIDESEYAPDELRQFLTREEQEQVFSDKLMGWKIKVDAHTLDTEIQKVEP